MPGIPSLDCEAFEEGGTTSVPTTTNDFSFQMGGNLAAGDDQPGSPRPLVRRESSAQELFSISGKSGESERPQHAQVTATLKQLAVGGVGMSTSASSSGRPEEPPQQGSGKARASEDPPGGSPPAARVKVGQERGFTQMDWLKLTRSGVNLAGVKGGPRQKIKMEEVKKHRSEDDCWSVLHGRVYNMGPYLRFHPGGVRFLMMGAGKDCTALFNKYHPWVNFEFLMEKCLVGVLDADSE